MLAHFASEFLVLGPIPSTALARQQVHIHLGVSPLYNLWQEGVAGCVVDGCSGSRGSTAGGAAGQGGGAGGADQHHQAGHYVLTRILNMYFNKQMAEELGSPHGCTEDYDLRSPWGCSN